MALSKKSAIINNDDSNYFTRLNYYSLKIIVEGVMKSWGAMAHSAPPPEPALVLASTQSPTKFPTVSRYSVSVAA